MDILPNFFVCSTPKTGSYSLWYYLSKHPDILMSKIKEPAYFFENSKVSYEKYISYFNHFTCQKAIGEASLYLGDTQAPYKIKKLIPDAKLIFCFRNPLERAISHYQYRLGRKDELRTLKQLLESSEIEFPLYYSLYSRHLKDFLNVFSIEQCMFIVAERMRKNFRNTLIDICRFLDVDDGFDFPYDGEKNITLPANNKLPRTVKNWNRGSGYKDGNYNRPGMIDKNHCSFYSKMKNICLVRLMKFYSSRERKTIIRSIGSQKLCEIKSLFQKEKRELEGLINIELKEWKFD